MVVNEPQNPNKLLCVDGDPDLLNITRKRKNILPRYPNYDFLQIEEVNQILYNYSKDGFFSTATIDTSLIFEALREKDKYYRGHSSFENVHYNFFNINFKKEKGKSTWYFTVRNRLWNGKWNITPHDTSKKYSYKRLPHTNKNTLVIEITSDSPKKIEELFDFDISFHMSNDDLPRKISIDNLVYDGSKSIKHAFDRDGTLQFKLWEKYETKDKKGKTIIRKRAYSGAICTFSDKNTDKPFIDTQRAKEIEKGKYQITTPKTKEPGKYTGYLKVYENEIDPNQLINSFEIEVENQQIYHVDIILDEKNPTIGKGSIKTFKGHINKTNLNYFSQHMTHDNLILNIYHTYNKYNTNPLSPAVKYEKQTDVSSVAIKKNGDFEFTINTRGNYDDTTKLKLNISNLEDYMAHDPIELTLQHEWYVADKYDDILNCFLDENGADVVVLKNKEYTRRNWDDKLEINSENGRTQYIIGKKGRNWATINNKDNGFNFIVHPPKNNDKQRNQLIMRGIKIKNSPCAISQENNTYVNAVSCCFEKCGLHPDFASVVYQDKTNTICDISHCYFNNCDSNLFLCKGNINLDSNTFIATDPYVFNAHEPYIASVLHGNLNFISNTIYTNPFESKTYISKDDPVFFEFKTYFNSPFGTTLFAVDINGKINSKTYTQLQGNNTLDLAGQPYSNKIWIIWYKISVDKVIYLYSTMDKLGNGFSHVCLGDFQLYNDGYKKIQICSEEDSSAYTMLYTSINDHRMFNPFFTTHNHNLRTRDPSIIIPDSGGVM